MKYKCPYCGSDENIKWWKAKSRYTCEHCNNHIFESVKTKLQVMYSIVVFAVCFSMSTIFFNSNVWGWKFPLFIILTGVSTSIISFILELVICRKFKSNYEK